MPISDLLRNFGLSAMPFGRAVPAGGLLQHKGFAEAHARLSLAIESRTPALLCAEPGLGKSTLLGVLADELDKSTTRLTYSQLCSCGPFGLTNQLAERYGMRPKRTAAQTARALLDDLSRSPKLEVLILDDAHRLPAESLDELRLLSNLDFDRAAPFSLLLCGQPALRTKLEQPELTSLQQRIGLRASLSPLCERDSGDYLERRLRAVGAAASIFRPAAVDKLFERTRGVPREINNCALAAMLAACAAGKKLVEQSDIEDAVFERENN
jgi:type II secretory pathway predicted ATPase ExeA